jgi:predicted nucleic acid-binding protein
LDELGCLELLADFSAILVPEGVWQEVKRHRASALRRRRLKLQLVAVVPTADPKLTELAQTFSLDAGEFAALSLMSQAPQAVLLTDDAAARLVGETIGYEVRGTIGIVVRALRRGQRTKRQVLNLLKAIPNRSSLFIEPGLLKRVIHEVEQN